MGQIWQAKHLDEKPEFPLEFPAALKNIISVGWSQKPRERPAIEKIKIALNVLKQEEETTHMGKVPRLSNLFKKEVPCSNKNTDKKCFVFRI